MAPKPLVPADFGIENLYSEFHGNVVLKLENKAEMKGNSMILSMNSSVFGDIFLNLQLRTLDMDDFSAAAVKIFLESLYTGEVEPNKGLFRDINKMANVFKVTWLTSKCENYFSDLVHNVENLDYDGMLFVFEEARFLKNSVKKPASLEIVVEKLCNLANKETVFIEKYMGNYIDFSTNQLDLMMHIAGENACIFMKVMKKNMEENMLDFDENTKYILENINLLKSMEQDKQQYEDLFDLLLEKTENISTKDLRMLTKLNRNATKEYHTLKQQRELESSAALLTTPTTSGTEVSPAQLVSPAQVFLNLFHRIEHFEKKSVDKFVDALFTSRGAKNIYMLFEAMDHQGKWRDITGDLLQKICSKIKQKQGCFAVSPAFLDSLLILTCSPDILKLIKSCSALVCTNSKRIASKKSTNIVLTKEKMHKFYFKHPKTTACSNPSQCGFLVKVTPVTKEHPEQFSMQLITDPTMYPADLHIHSDLISVDNMHFAVEMYNELFMKWNNVWISWTGKPYYDGGQKARWGGVYDNDKVKFVIYYNCC